MPLEVTSINNMSEDDGLANLYACLNGLLLGPERKRMLVGITPEYDMTDGGRLMRVHVLSVEFMAPGPERPSALDAEGPVTIHPVKDSK